MNKTDAKKIAQDITLEQLSDMFNKAKSEISNWEAVSAVNKGMTKGTAWNILKGGFDSMNSISYRDRGTSVKNMIWEFGDYLDESIKPKKEKKKPSAIKSHHQQPEF